MPHLRPTHQARGPARHRRPTAALAALTLVVGSLVGLGLAASPASASVTGVSGGAYGLSATLLGGTLLSPQPAVTAPAGGTATQTAVNVPVPGLVTTKALSATSTTTGVPGPTGTVTSSASVAGVNALVGALQVGAVSSTCTSGASGSTAATTVVGLKIDGTAVSVPSPVPPNFGLSVPGLATVELNRQVTSDTPGATSATVAGLYVQVLGVLGLTTITVAESACGATGPDVDAVPTVTSLDPTSGPAVGGTQVTITGTDLTGVTGVDFGATPATDVTVVSPTQITALSPAGTGTVDVTLTSAAGSSPADPAADDFTYLPTPTVSAVLPDTGPPAGGQTVTITGTGLAGATSVDFGSTPATGVVCTDSSCTVTSPAGTGGTTVPVTVTGPDGTSPVTPASQYTYGTAPAVTGLSPTSGPTAGGTLVTVDGANLTGATAVDFGTNAASIVSCAASECMVISPAGAPGTVPVTVTTSAGTSPAGTTAGDFTYVVAPAVSGISPSTGPTAGGTPVTVDGSGLCNAAAVDFGTTPATSFTVNGTCTEITATSPPGAAGTDDVTVTTPGGTSPTSPADQFTYAAAPTVLTVTPTSGPTDGGTVVTLTGSGLTGATAVDFGSTPAPVFGCTSDTSCTATSPPGTGTVPVTVTTAGGTSSGSAVSDFTYTESPTVTSVNPSTGPASGGTTVTVTGTGLTGATAVDFGSTPGTVVSCTDTACSVVSPAGTAGSTVPVTVTTPNGTSPAVTAGDFTYGNAPAVSSVAPTSGPIAGGTPVTITGVNLTGATAVDFGPTPATDVSCSDIVCTAVAPAGAGTVDVTVTTPDGTSPTVAADQFTYLSTPTVTGVSPATGPSTGGTTVTVTGTGLCDATGVDFGTVPATDVTVDPDCTQVTATSPPGSGPVDVTVTTPGGTSPTVPADTFTYAPVPVVSSITPVYGPAAGGTVVTITGAGLTGTTGVDFGTSAGTSVSCSSDTSCTATSPAGTGTVAVTVTTPGGTSVGAPTSSFTYIPAPTITGLSPNTGPAAGGTAVTITGGGLSGATAVDFGGVPATIVACTDVACEVVSPAGTAGTSVPVTVTTPDGSNVPTPAGTFTYGTAPAVDGVDPSAGPEAGGTSVTVTGANLLGATAVDFGTTPATGVTCTDTSCTVTAPAGTGAVDVTVTTPTGGTSPTSDADTYTYLAVPTVASISPVSGPTAGGTTVTISGTGLTDTTAVTFGTDAATSFTCTSDTSCTAVSPSETAGTVEVTVTTPGGTSTATSAGDFTFIAPFPYHGVTPYRIADTRTGSGEPYAGEPIGPGGSLDVQVTGTGTGTDSVPADATVAVLNVTEAQATAASFFTVYPTGDARPNASSVNFPAKSDTPNLVEVALGAGGKVTVYNHAGTADLVVDVEGYVAPPSPETSTAGRFNAMAPARITDTRKGSGEPNAGKMLTSGYQHQAGSTLQVQVTGKGGVPTTGVSAVVLNVTEADATVPSFFTVYPTGKTLPNSSNVNFTKGQDVADRVIVPVGTNGTISVFNHAGDANVVIDVNGWFTSAAASTGDIYSGVVPFRIADTRPDSGLPESGKTLGAYSSGSASSTLVLPVAGVGGVPRMSAVSPPTAVVLDVTAVDTTAPSYLTIYPDGEARPVASDVNWEPNEIRSNLVVVKVGPDGDIDLTNWTGSTNALVDVVGFYTSSGLDN